MNKFTLFFFAFLYSAASLGDSVSFYGLKVPKENIGLSAFSEQDNIYDDATGSELIVFNKKDLVGIGLNYDLADNEPFVSLMIYSNEINVAQLSKSLMSDVNTDALVERDKYTNETRLHKTKDRWLLQNKKGRVLASCYRGSSIVNGEIKDTDICNFITNVSGFGFKYSLSDENIEKYKCFEKYLAEQINSWKNVNKN